MPLPSGGKRSHEVAEGDVFLASAHRSTLEAVDLETGAPRWQAPLPARDLTAPVASPDGTVWVCGEQTLAAFDGETGEPKGTWPTGARFGLQPVPRDEGGVVVGNWQSRTVAALAPDRAEPLWTAPVGYTSQPVATAPGRVYVNVDSAVQALDAATGEPLWRFAAGGALSSPPSVGPDGTVYSAATRVDRREATGVLNALDPRTGEPRWTFDTPAGLSSPALPSEDGQTVYLGTREGRVHALDAATGEPRWSLETAGPVVVSPGEADGLLCVADERNRVLLVQTRDGLILAETDLDSAPRSAPVPLGDGAFLVETVLSQGVKVSLPGPEPDFTGSIAAEDREVQIGDIRLPVREPAQFRGSTTIG